MLAQPNLTVYFMMCLYYARLKRLENDQFDEFEHDLCEIIRESLSGMKNTRNALHSIKNH